MKLSYCKDTDSLYINLLDKPSVESQEVSSGIVLDFDKSGALVGIDIDHASQNINLHNLETSSLPLNNIAFK